MKWTLSHFQHLSVGQWLSAGDACAPRARWHVVLPLDGNAGKPSSVGTEISASLLRPFMTLVSGGR